MTGLIRRWAARIASPEMRRLQAERDAALAQVAAEALVRRDEAAGTVKLLERLRDLEDQRDTARIEAVTARAGLAVVAADRDTARADLKRLAGRRDACDLDARLVTARAETQAAETLAAQLQAQLDALTSPGGGDHPSGWRRRYEQAHRNLLRLDNLLAIKEGRPLVGDLPLHRAGGPPHVLGYVVTVGGKQTVYAPSDVRVAYAAEAVPVAGEVR